MEIRIIFKHVYHVYLLYVQEEEITNYIYILYLITYEFPHMNTVISNHI